MESRAAVTNRLRRERRWERACQFREQHRQQLRDKGVPRRDAVNQAWTAMIERFPPLSSQEIVWGFACEYTAMAAFPPREPSQLLDEDGEISMACAWWTFWHTAGRLICLCADDLAGASVLAKQMVCDDQAPADAVAFCESAFVAPRGTLMTITDGKFRAVIGRLNGEAGHGKLAAELQQAIDLADRLCVMKK